MYICLVFSVNLIGSISLPFEYVQAMEDKLGLQYKFDQKKSFWSRICFLNSWMNVFFMSRQVDNCSYFRTIHMVLLLIGQFILNIVTIVVLICIG